MNNEAQRFYDFLDNTQAEVKDDLWQYVQSLNPEMVAQMSQPQSGEVQQVMERQIIGLLGALSGEGINVSVTMTRENLGRLLGSAIMSGYFLRNAEQRHEIEKMLASPEESL
ncbi:DUF760 domain-containing protein [[Limnothrix rosea] IAM M-220]|uniref:DUF760 domain-containing protein n=1 Tax=[Limnothrix rosea] IAM M-220 TaxID=454133 RepID=UPI000968DDF7|nr:DUF760 domain-containing protein [[Limnothrix rosea] IAM M-220]OKH14223.1 hypothetical protein NIES208_14000 [[Limnothrix rosea] IAM M-220]